MKALSVRQPYASQILRGEKTLELRSKPTTFRGDILICASKHGNSKIDQLPRGVALCKVRIVGTHKMTPEDSTRAKHDYVPGLHAWELDQVQPVEPFPVSGKLGFFEVEESVIETRR